MRNRSSKSELFGSQRFEREIIVFYVCWYLRCKPSYRDLVEITAKRSLSFARTTILLWERRYTLGFDKRWSRFAAQAGKSLRVGETYVRIRGQWAYLDRTVHSSRKTVDFWLSIRRNVAFVVAFFRKGIRSQGWSLEIVRLDAYTTSHRPVRKLQQPRWHHELTKVSSSKYMNNLTEQVNHNGNPGWGHACPEQPC